MNKIAVVFHGIIGGAKDRNGVGDSIDYKVCAKSIKEHILDNHDCDIFIHSWSTDYEKELTELYKPKKAVFQEQEYFGYDPEAELSTRALHGFRATSKYTSFKKAVQLKKNYEVINGFKYDWVIVLRFDLIFFTTPPIDSLDPHSFYVCSEPHWEANFPITEMTHDIVFLSNSLNMNKFSQILTDVPNLKGDAHRMAATQLKRMYKDQKQYVKIGFKRYQDVEIIRFLANPKLNPIGHQYGALEASKKFKEKYYGI